jgi:hypothetical protein
MPDVVGKLIEVENIGSNTHREKQEETKQCLLHEGLVLGSDGRIRVTVP